MSVQETLNFSALLYNPETEKIWIKHEVFGKVLVLLPFGFLIDDLFCTGTIIILSKIYDLVASNRTDISKFFGLPACDLNIKPIGSIDNNEPIIFKYEKTYSYLRRLLMF